MKIRFNMLDWIILGALLLVLLFFGYRVFFAGQSMFADAETVTMYYQVEFRRQTEEFRDAVDLARTADTHGIGETVYVSARERDSAEIINVRAIPARTLELDRVNDVFNLEVNPGYYDVIITLRTRDVVVTDRAFMNGRTAIRVGAQSIIRGRGFAAEGFIVNMWFEGEEPMFDLLLDQLPINPIIIDEPDLSNFIEQEPEGGTE